MPRGSFIYQFICMASIYIQYISVYFCLIFARHHTLLYQLEASAPLSAHRLTCQNAYIFMCSHPPVLPSERVTQFTALSTFQPCLYVKPNMSNILSHHLTGTAVHCRSGLFSQSLLKRKRGRSSAGFR